jgi:hypothetical protein
LTLHKKEQDMDHATEGQVQTIAAAMQLITDLSKSTGEGGMVLFNDFVGRAKEVLAAQFAGSTSPGAPVESINEMAARIFDFKLHKQTPESLVKYTTFARALLAAPTAQQSLTAGGAVPEDIDFSDRSTAPAVEKARRVLQSLADGSISHFHSDGFPRCAVIKQDAKACLKVLSALNVAAAPLPQVKP